MVNYTYLGVSGNSCFFLKYSFLLSEDLYTFTYSEDPGEMLHYAAFHLGLHCFERYSFRGLPDTKGLKNFFFVAHCVVKLNGNIGI